MANIKSRCCEVNPELSKFMSRTSTRMALFGQGDEGIFNYYNQGEGKFKEEPVLRFPPSYGSSFFDLTNINEDGFVDIIYSAGDNADYPPVVKPYHGIRIYLNDQQNHFFYSLPGAHQAIPADFDQDGDQDILLGSLAFEVITKGVYLQQWIQEVFSFLVLENQVQ